MKKALILAALQVGVILAWAGYHERLRASTPTFRIPLRPIDPFDLVRGRYFILNPQDADLKVGQPDVFLAADAVDSLLRGDREYAGTARIGFCLVDQVRRVCALRRPDDAEANPQGALWASGHAMVHWEQPMQPGWRVTLELQLERFFLPNRLQLPGPETEPGWELEVSHRPDQPLLPRRLWFKGQPLPTGD